MKEEQKLKFFIIIWTTQIPLLSSVCVLSLQASHHGGRGPRHPAGVAADGSGRWAGHAAHRSGAALHAAAHVGQRRPLLRDVSFQFEITNKATQPVVRRSEVRGLCADSLPLLVPGVLLGRSSRRSVRSSWTRALLITCWRSRPEPSPTTWTCLQSAPGGSWEWTGPSRRCATGWWWWSSTTGPAETWPSSVSR